MAKHSENDHEIVLETSGKLVSGFIYNTNEEKKNFFQIYFKTIQTGLYQTFQIKNNPTRHVRSEKKGELKIYVDYKKKKKKR